LGDLEELLVAFEQVVDELGHFQHVEGIDGGALA